MTVRRAGFRTWHRHTRLGVKDVAMSTGSVPDTEYNSQEKHERTSTDR